MTVLVTGATGFVGGAITRSLIEHGYTVRILARRTSSVKHLKDLGVETAYGDIFDQDSIRTALNGCDTLFHAAALYDLWGLGEHILMQTECQGTLNVLEAALASGITKVVYTSSALTIGERKGEIGTESTPHRGYFLSKYEHAKYEAEQIVHAYLNKGLPIIIVNPANVYGPGDLKPSGRVILALLNGRLPALGRGMNSLVYLDDVGSGHVLAAEKGTVGERYIFSGSCVSVKDWAEVICALTNTRMPPSIPAVFVGIYSLLGEFISRFTKQPPVLSWETFRLVSHGFRVDGSKAVRELGMEYLPLREGLQRTVAWYRDQGLLRK